MAVIWMCEAGATLPTFDVGSLNFVFEKYETTG
jgi:hypothetical protein